MERDTAYWITLLSAFVHGRQPELAQVIDWERVCHMGQIHAVSGIVYFMAQGQPETCRPSAPLWQTMKREFCSTLARSATQDEVMGGVIDAFCKAGMPHLIFKGYAMKNCYPVKELRTMGDIDILIKSADRAKSDALLRELGFRSINASGNVWHYARGSVQLEMHTELLSRNINCKFDYMDYFSKAWDHASPQPNGYTYAFSPAYHLLFMLVHIAKHFRGCGCGIRMIMDVAMYVIHYEDELDWDNIAQELGKLHLAEFARNIFGLCRQWFDVRVPPPLPVLNERLNPEISAYILAAGTFGFYGRNKYTSILRSFNAGAEGDARPATGRLYLNYFFPSYEMLNSIPPYSFVKNHPWLLPAAWIYRIARGIIARGGSSFGVLIDIAGGKKDYGRQRDIISKVGL